ncbi:MAG: alpha/beta hydrolase [Sandaracinaceae bacterium]|nr:alpha/beta hydrolase [Sandaracinaceae bacterium]
MARLDLGSHSVEYRDAGEGAPVVLLHSGGLGARQWTRLAGRLEGAHRVIAPSFLGTAGTSGVPRDADFHFHQDVALVEGLLDALGVGPAHVVGHSYGGLVGLTLARRQPRRVLSLALFEPVAFGVLYSTDDAEGIRDLEREDDDGAFFDDAVGGQEPWLERFIDWWQGPGSWAAMSDAGRETFLAVGRKVYQEVRSLTADRTPHDGYGEVRAPTLLMTAERSPLAARRVVAILGEHLPNATVSFFPGAGHMAPLTDGHTVNAAIVEHLGRV